MKKITTALVAAIISISVVVPFVTQAQTTTPSNSSLVALLTQLVQILEQELQQLLVQHNATSTQQTPQPAVYDEYNPGLLIATPTSGTAPLAIQFNIAPDAASANSIDFGDGNSCNDASDVTECIHTYMRPGTYTANLLDVKSEVLSTATITVTGSGTPQ